MSSALPSTPAPALARIPFRPRRSPESPARGLQHGLQHGADGHPQHGGGGGLQGALQGQHYGPLWFVQVTANDHSSSGHASTKPRRSGLAIQGPGETAIGCVRSPVSVPSAPMPAMAERPRAAHNHGLGLGLGLGLGGGPRPVNRVKRRTLKLLAVDRSPPVVTAAAAKTNNSLNHAGHYKSQAAAKSAPRADRRSASSSSSSRSSSGPRGARMDALHTRVSVTGSVTGSMSGSSTRPVPSAHRDSFHGAMCPALMVAQCFALLPVDGISRNHPGVPQFRWLSFRVFYTVAVFTGTGVVALLAAYRMISEGLSFQSSVTVVFFGNSLSAMVLFLQLATRWPAVARAWARIEYDMRTYGYPRHLGRKIKIMTAIVLLLATVEHLLAVMTAVYTSWPCYKSGGFPGLIRGYSLNNFAMVLQVTEYAPWKAAFVFLLNVVATFSWNYTDLFIMLLSVSLAQRFKQLNHRLRALKGKNLPSGVWRQLRETYNSLACLTRTVDEAVNNIVLLSFASNLYFICVQLLQGMKLIMDVYPYVYFFFSFGYLLLRTCVVSLYAASIHDESKEPRRVLYSVPSESFCSEVRRFLAQVTTDDVALTGCNFFSVTRSLMLTVAGTIVTYEIVLVQFQGVSGDGSSEPTAKAPNITVRCF